MGEVGFSMFMWNSYSEKVTYMSCLGKVFERFQRFKNFRHFRVFALIYRANSKRWKRREIYKTPFQWQTIEWVLISWVSANYLDGKFPESSIWIEIYSVGNNESHVEQ